MSRLLVSTFIRMLKKVIFWFFVLCMFAYGVYSALNIASGARIGFVLDGCLFECLPLMGHTVPLSFRWPTYPDR